MRILGKIVAVSMTGILLAALAFLIFSKPVSKVTVVSLGPGRVKPQIAVEGKQVFMVAPDGSLWRWGSVWPWAKPTLVLAGWGPILIGHRSLLVANGYWPLKPTGPSGP